MLSEETGGSGILPIFLNDEAARMLYAILCYNSEATIGQWRPEEDQGVMTRHEQVMKGLAMQGKMGPTARLMPTPTAKSIRTSRDKAVLDGPFAETKEQLLGFYVVDCESMEEATEIAKQFAEPPGGTEVRPVHSYFPAAIGQKG